ncbi:MAG TPA: FGGY family carbohydrate kinase [Gaiellales bacterium]
MSELLLGVDVGTASTKAVLATPDGTIVASASREHRVSLPRPGFVEHDPEAAWWQGVLAVCHELLPGRADAVAAVGVSGIGPCVVPCGVDGRPLRPAILYGVDTRAGAEVALLTELLGDDAIRARCGSALSSQALGPKLLWLSRNEPEVWAATRRWQMASSFVNERLTGAWVLDHASASQCDPLYDLDACAWYEPWAEIAAPGLPLPPLAWPGELIGEVTPAAALATGLRPGTPVIAGTIDAWAEAVSVDVRRPGDLMLMYGSTMFLIGAVDARSEAPAAWMTRGADPGSLTAAAGMATSGSITAWLRELAGSPPFDELAAEAAALEPGSDGLLLLPYFQGERTPILDPNARGVIAGLTLGHTRAHLYRAALEGVAYGVRHNLEALQLSPRRVIAVGGGAGGGIWPRIVSDVCGVEQVLPRETIGASLGDALLAAEAVGLTAPMTSWMREQERLAPDPATRGVYDESYLLYRELHEATAEIQHALAARQLSPRAASRPGSTTRATGTT